MKRLKIILFTLIFCCFSLFINAQANTPSNNEIKISINPKKSNDQLIIIGKIENLSNNTFQLNYELLIQQRHKKSFKSRQKNNFQLDPFAQLEIGKITVPFHPKAIYDISLKIFHDTALISYIELNNEEKKPFIGTGLIVDATRTKNGHDFYSLFNKYWIASEAETNAMIRIEEKPGRSRSTQILVFINNNLVMRKFLQRTYHKIQDQAKYGVDITLDILKNNPSLNELYSDGDLMGNGLN